MPNFLKTYFNYILLVFSFGILLFFSFHFALERIISADTADYIVKLINTEWFYAGSYRFIAYFTQLIPLLLIQWQAPFNAIAQWYSVNFMLFHIVVIGLIAFQLKDIFSAFIALLGLLVAGSSLFYYPVTEYQMGLVLSVYLFAFLKKYFIENTPKYTHFLIVLLLLIISVYSHPLTLFFLFFIIVYLWLEKNLDTQKVVLFSSVLLIIFLSKYFLFSVEHDTSNSSVIRHLKFFPLPAFLVFWEKLVTYYYQYIALFFMSIFGLIYAKKYKFLVFYILYFYIHLHLSLSKIGAGMFNWYSVHICQILFFMPALVFMETFIPQIKKQWIQSFLLVSFIALSLAQIPSRKNFNRERIAVLDHYIQQAQKQNITRGIVSPSDKGNQLNYWFWGIEYESLVLSKYKYNQAITILYKPIKQVKAIRQQENLFLTGWGSWPITYFNAYYFPFARTPYQEVVLEGKASSLP